jgi:hypothetical protein
MGIRIDGGWRLIGVVRSWSTCSIDPRSHGGRIFLTRLFKTHDIHPGMSTVYTCPLHFFADLRGHLAHKPAHSPHTYFLIPPPGGPPVTTI